MTRNDALDLLKREVKTKNLIKHMIAAEAVMRKLALLLDEDEEQWALAGLLHDIDYDDTKDDPARHSQVGADMLRELDLNEQIIQAVRSHNDAHGIPRVTNMAKALYSVDPLTGLIVAAALIHPAKKLLAIDADFVLNRYYEKHFAKGAKREAIAACSEFGLDLPEFIAVGVAAMQEAVGEIGF
jgi:hypothetical protein